MSTVETRAHVKSLRAFAPTCNDSPDSSGLSAQRTYRSGRGVQGAIESALLHTGWVATRAPNGDAYVAQLKSGRFTSIVELTVNADSEETENEGGSFIQAVYSFN
jgi:hypothetical protein